MVKNFFYLLSSILKILYTKLMRNTLILIGFLAFLAVIFGVNYVFKPFAPKDQIDLARVSPTPKPSPALSVDQETRSKLASILMAPLVITPETRERLPEWIIKNKPGAILIYGQGVDLPTVDQINQQLAKIQLKDRGFQPLLGTILDGGVEQPLTGEGFTPLPTWRKLCQGGLVLAKRRFATAAAELGTAGINLVLSPSLDVASASTSADPRLCSLDARKVALYGQAFISAMNNQGILSVVKHFPGIGQLQADLDSQFLVTSPTKKDLLPFKAVLDRAEEDKVYSAVLVSLVGVKQSGDGACALTKSCVDQVSGAYQKVLIVSDDLGQKAALYDPLKKDYTKSLSQVAYEAVMAGNHLLYFGQNVSYSQLTKVLDDLTLRYKEDRLFKAKVDAAKVMLDSVKSHHLGLEDF